MRCRYVSIFGTHFCIKQARLKVHKRTRNIFLYIRSYAQYGKHSLTWAISRHLYSSEKVYTTSGSRILQEDNLTASNRITTANPSTSLDQYSHTLSTRRSTPQSLLRSPKSQQKTCLYQESTTTKICRCSSAAVIRYRKQHPNTFSDVNPSAAPSVVYAQTLRSAVQQIPLQQFLSPWSLPLRTGATSNPPHPFQPPRLVLGEARGTLEVYIDLSCGFSWLLQDISQ